MFQLLFYSEGVTLSTLLRSHRFRNLPSNPNESQRIIIRRKHVWEDALHQLKCGFDVHKHPKVTFVGEPAVDDGGPRREFFHLLIGSIAGNNHLFCGDETSRVPMHNMMELGKRTYYYVGMMLALSLVHGGPSPKFFSAAMADYIVYGMGKVKATPGDVPDHAMRKKLIKVCCHIHRYACEMVTESHYLASLIPVENNIYCSRP